MKASRHQAGWLAIHVGLTALCATTGCQREPLGESTSSPHPVSSSDDRTLQRLSGAPSSKPTAAHGPDFYQRAVRQFGIVDYFKPSSQTGELASVMAPLILQEIDARTPRTAFGKILSTESLQIDSSRPTVYFSSDSLSIQNKTYPRVAYVWCYSGDDTVARVQGVRITMDRTGQPLLWEPLVDSSSNHLIFVAESVERARTNQPINPGRRFHVEPSHIETPQVIVPRILDDGPVPMGPIVYQAASNRDILTILCRCMPAQATNLLGNTTYQLEQLNQVLPVLEKLRPPKAQWWPGAPETPAARRILAGDP